jgi:hypothetical protein
MALWHLGGAVARPATQDTAFGKRTAPYLLSYDSCWIDPKQGDAVVQWTITRRLMPKADFAESDSGSKVTRRSHIY